MKFITRSINSNRFSHLTRFLVVGFLLVIHIRLYAYSCDDAYIHFRVARNLVETGKPYYNAGDALKVSSSSGWTIFLAILFGGTKILGADRHFPLLIGITNATVIILGSYVYQKILETLLKKRLTHLQKILFQSIFMAILLPSSIGLMETPFALLIAGLGIYGVLISKPSGFALLGIASFIRLEWIILLALTSLFVLIKKPFRLRQMIGYGVLGTIPLIFYDLYFFATVVPHSIIAKSTVYSLSPLYTLVQVAFLSLPAVPIPHLNQNGTTCLIFLVLVMITSWVSLREKDTRTGLWPILFSLLGLGVMSLYVLGRSYLFGWYIPLYMIPMLMACFSCSFLTQYPRNIILKLPLFAVFSLSMISLATTFYAAISTPSDYVEFVSGSRVKTYIMIGKILNDEYPKATLLSSEIGGLGYSFRGYIFDAAGLASSDALNFHPMKVPQQRASGVIGAIPPEYVQQVMPDIIVSYDYFSQALRSSSVINRYNVIAIPAYLPSDAIYSKSQTIWGSKYLRIYIQKSLPVSKKICDLAILDATSDNACNTR